MHYTWTRSRCDGRISLPRAFPYQTPTGREYDSGDYEAVLAKALHLAEYEGLGGATASAAAGRFMGIGIATTVDASGLAPPVP